MLVKCFQINLSSKIKIHSKLGLHFFQVLKKVKKKLFIHTIDNYIKNIILKLYPLWGF